MDYSFQETLPQNRFAHTVLVGQITDSSGVFKRCFVSTHTVDSAVYAVSYGNNEEYQKIGLAPLEAVFRPYSTNNEASGILHFENPEGSAPRPNINDYNPFGSGIGYSDIDFAISGSEITNGKTISTRDSDFDYIDIRSICLKAPLIVGGWGFDKDGRPVPNENEESPTDNFLQDYRQRTDKWKVGPIDLRWDYSRKLWSVGDPGFKLAVVIAHSGGSAGQRPIYICREIGSISENGGLYYIPTTSIQLFMGADSGVFDRITFNIQEAGGDNHTIGIGSPVYIKRESADYNGENGEVYFMSEHPRTLVTRRY